MTVKQEGWERHKMNVRTFCQNLSIGASLLIASTVFSQGTVASKRSEDPHAHELPQFVAISIHPLKDPDTGFGGGFVGTTYRAHAYTTQMLIWEATGVHDVARIKGMPKWATETEYDINAKIDGTVSTFKSLTKDQARAMILSILSTRFNFTFHYETATLPVLNLVVAKGGVKNMTPYVPENTALPRHQCFWPGGTWSYINAKGCSMQDLAKKLNEVDDREVVDHTELSGRYSFELHFDDTATSWWVDGSRFAATYKGNAEWPSIYSALTGQLGLKLIKEKTALPVLIIDSITPPTDN